MFCPKCGANLSETETKCPLCQLVLPEIQGMKREKPLYPHTRRPRDKGEFRGLLFAVAILFLGVGGSGLALDLVWKGEVTFSGYLLFLLGFLYATFFLPRWFVRPNPVIFFPVSFFIFAAALLYLNLATDGNWYWGFALPVLGAIFLFLETAVTLIHYLKRGKPYVYGSLFLSFGILSFVAEILFRAVFDLEIRLTFSLIPLIFCSVLGLGIIVITVVPPFRAYFAKRFFV